jgi:hypothetical protein
MKQKLFCIILFLIIAASAVSADISSNKIISVSLVNQDPDPAIAGGTVELRIGIENSGGKNVDDLMIELVPEYPFSLVPGYEAIQDVGNINAYQTGSSMKVIKYKLKIDSNANAVSYDIKINDYEKGSSVKTQSTLEVDVKNRESAEIIYIDKTTLIPGKETNMSFIIQNVGNAPLRDLTFSWVNSDKIILPVGGDNTKYVKYIDVGESAELKYKVIADSNADAGLYELSLQLSYDDVISGVEKEINTIAGVYVGGGTDFDVTFSESSGNDMSFTIANIGSNPAFSVSVIVPQQEGWSVSGASSMIIGNLNKGDYTVASFTLQQGMSSAMQTANMTRQRQAQNSLKIQIAYTNTMGARELVEKEIVMGQQTMNGNATTSIPQFGRQGFGRIQQQSFISKYKWYILGLVVLVAFGVLYRKYRKEKLVNPDFKFKDMINKIKTMFKRKKKDGSVKKK